MAEKILKCLDECFNIDGLYITGLDADTDHQEGITYLWSYEQLKNELLPDEFERFTTVYSIDKNGNFDDMIHLVRKTDDPLDDVEDKLLAIRRKRKQPSQDNKILCGINALLVIAMVQAGRFLERTELEMQASQVMRNLLNKFWNGKFLKHSFYEGIFQEQCYLFDAAAILSALTMLSENDESWKNIMTDMTLYVESFIDGDKWIESRVEDFQTVYASWLDHPVPSSVSLAELGLTRNAFLTGKNLPSKQYREPFKSDFYNIVVMMNNGLFHLFESTKVLSWNLLPVNSLRIKGTHETDCFMGVCRPLETGF